MKASYASWAQGFWTCGLCPHACRLKPGHAGLCGARGVEDGEPVALSYARVSSIALDPIEKKPLSHFMPGSRILSVGSFGCNFRCPFCQNHAISQERPETMALSPEQLVAKALECVPLGSIGVAYTYNEPIVGIEYVLDSARLVHEAGLLNVLVTNGYATAEPWRDLMAVTDACNIDLKAFNDRFYRELCGGDRETVMENIRMAASLCHVELTCLVIPGWNDDDAEMDRLASWIATIDPDIPLHISRYFPRYRMANPGPTPASTVKRLAEVAGSRLRHVHDGNL